MMGPRASVGLVSLWLLGYLLVLPASSFAAGLPKSTQKILDELKLDVSILAGVDEELEVRKDWMEKARREGKLKIRSIPATTKVTNRFLAPFRERYSFIDTDYFGASRRSRTIKTLEAFRAGRYLADLVANVGSNVVEFEQSGGVEDLRGLPALRSVPATFKDPNGAWTGTFTLFWCISYNTRLVSREDLPKRWEDLLTNPIWRNGNLALGNRPNLWVANLWVTKGEQWTKNFVARLFTEVQPQLRKEGMSALSQLAAAGEFHAVVPSHYERAFQLAQDGAPVSFFCPEPVPAAVGGGRRSFSKGHPIPMPLRFL